MRCVILVAKLVLKTASSFNANMEIRENSTASSPNCDNKINIEIIDIAW